MVDRLYCLSNPAEPGLVRLARWGAARGEGVRMAGEKIDWALTIRDGGACLADLDRLMRLYRKDRGGGVYRCSPGDARAIAVRHVKLAAFGIPDTAVDMLMIAALVSGILAVQAPDMSAAKGLCMVAASLTALTVCLATLRRGGGRH